MYAQARTETTTRPVFQRDLGSYGGIVPGPLVIAIGGIHGNEPAGALALQSVLSRLHQIKPAFKGRLVALSGNVRALNQGVRYLHSDLNRMWRPEHVQALKSGLSAVSQQPERIEQRELLAAIESALGNAREPRQVIVLDLHTTSSEGAPFALFSDTLFNRRLAMRLGVPSILGLEENIEGTILNYINELGFAAVGFEAGQHQAHSSVENHEAAIWLTLMEAGCIAAWDVPERVIYRQRLRTAARGLPTVLELRYRHGIDADDAFAMNPGFTNFFPVQKGQPVARDRRGEVRAPENGFLFMPLYQSQGDDGFFLIREVRPIWLSVSAAMRRLGLERLLPWLPGVHQSPDDADSLVINTRVAHWLAIEICHLCGYRKQSHEQDRLIVKRRRQN